MFVLSTNLECLCNFLPFSPKILFSIGGQTNTTTGQLLINMFLKMLVLVSVSKKCFQSVS